VFPNSLRQRCAIHRARNILAKIPVEHQPEVKAAYWAIFDPTGEPPGERSIAVARARAKDFSTTFGRRFPSAVACLNGALLFGGWSLGGGNAGTSWTFTGRRWAGLTSAPSPSARQASAAAYGRYQRSGSWGAVSVKGIPPGAGPNPEPAMASE
jgi:hypothetical protein